MVEIKGDMLEGGGQLLRISTAISAIMKNPLMINNIRANRKPPGLRAQHLNAVKAIGKLTSAEIEGLTLGSNQITFTPRVSIGGNLTIDVGTAGSTSLVLQALMPVMAFSPEPVSLEVNGGTNNSKAPAIEYIQNIVMPIISKMGYQGSVDLIRRGFYPRGMGRIIAYCKPIEKLKPLILTEMGHPVKLWGLSYSCHLPSHISERMAKSAQKLLVKEGYDAMIITECLEDRDVKCSIDPGCGIILFSSLSSGGVLGSDALGKLGTPAEKIGEEAASHLLNIFKQSAPIDEFLSDQLIIYAALADGKSEMKVAQLTLHTLTCIELCKKLLGNTFQIDGRIGEPSHITCNGISVSNKYIL
ncbi:RNA 3'-terminal phosphate cyclase [[Eubacterium] cellulosolvens]